MRITVLGTGVVGRTLTARLDGLVARSLARTWAGGEDADGWRVEAEGLGSQLREAGAPEQVFDFEGGVAGRACRGASAAGLGRDGYAPAGCESLAQLAEPLGRRGP